jgi:hypothetical protein
MIKVNTGNTNNYKKIIKNQLNENENENEKILLLKIQELAPELICLIYNYLTGRPKFLCNKKYNFLESVIKGDCYKEYTFWNYLKSIFDPMTKNQILYYLKNGYMKYHPFIIDKIWLFSRDTNKYYDKENLIKLWSGEIIDPIFEKENKNSVNYLLKTRIIDAIYYYFLRSIEIYEKKMYLDLQLNLTAKLNYQLIFQNMDKLFYLYKSIVFMKNNNYTDQKEKLL